MSKRQVSYIFAAIIVLISVIYLGIRVNNHNIARQAEEELYLRHQLTLTTGDDHYAGTNFIAAVQLRDMEGNPVKAELTVSLPTDNSEEYFSFITDNKGKATIIFPLHVEATGSHTLYIDVESELYSESFTKTINIIREDGLTHIVSFDKGLYKPGDDVLFRILALESGTAHPFARESYTISIFDGNDNRVYHEYVRTSDFGIIFGRFRLAEEVNSGLYRLEVAHNGITQTQAHFSVSPYVLPKFEILLETDKEEYNVGDTIYITGSVNYFFGEPVNQGIVNVFINGEAVLLDTPLTESGGFSLYYVADMPQLYNIWVEVIDNSNHRVEHSLSVRASEGPFDIELLPEHGYLVQNMPNTVYVFTNKADGTPIRANLQITGRGFSRQVATDSNGIGIFILEDVHEDNPISVRGQDMDGNIIEREFRFDGFERNVTLSTDKPRYAMGETIRVSLNSLEEDGTFNIYVYKNSRLLQFITTQYNHVELNLGDEFGLIDIFASWSSDTYDDEPIDRQVDSGGCTCPSCRDDFTFVDNRSAKTIFVDPGRLMQISVQSDRSEYMPGDFVNLSIGVTDDKGVPLEAALLVSMVDEAMLNLAANDLSIDNIKLALEGIRFTEELDAATLYASLIADASEQAITRLLLRRSTDAPMPQTVTLFNDNLQGRNVLRNMAIVFYTFLLFVFMFTASIIFFILQTRKKSPNTMRAPNAPYAQYYANYSQPVAQEYTMSKTEESPSADKVAKGAVIVAIILFLFALFFITSCADDGFAPVADTPAAEAPAPADDVPMAVADEREFFAFFDDDAAPAQEPAPTPEFERDASVEITERPPVEHEEGIERDPPDTVDIPDREVETQTARVRRLFLETMLFIPELISRDGHAELDFILADNITTWNIQIVGNTQDGLVGHTESSIRAFQPFFVDFELPRNSIRYDQVSIPVTVFNYTEQDQDVILTIAEMDWFILGTDPVQTLTVPSNQSQMVYIPITIVRFGDFVFRAYADTRGFADAAEKSLRVSPEGFRIMEVVSSGSIESSVSQHLIFMNEDIPDTRRAHVKFYPSTMSQLVEGMENIFRMPTGCFEQISSTLYPNILALRYMQNNQIDNPELTRTALEFISSGYQRLLTYEVRQEPGGFSMYGHAPANTLLTAYGLMQLKDLTSVYTIDERVLDRMADFLFGKQNRDGSFELTGRGTRGLSTEEELAFNAYITWALSEAFPTDNRLFDAIDFLISNMHLIDDNYTLALLANILVNTNDPLARDVINQLHANIERTGEGAYLTSSSRDYFGTSGRMQNLQTTALTSLALSRSGSFSDTNDLLINYIIAQRDSWGTWHSTQATILSLKALTAHDPRTPIQDGQITVTIGDQQQTIDIRADSRLDFYKVSFSDLERENIIDIRFPDLGRMVYQIVLEYYAPYDSVELDRGFHVTSTMNTHLSVHELVEQHIRIENRSGAMVHNAMVTISIPQGFRVEQSSLAALLHRGIVERYETRFETINLYLKNTEPGEIIEFSIAYRPAYPVIITGGHLRVFDYYNPSIEGFLRPFNIVVE